MKNYIGTGAVMDVVLGGTVASGSVVQVGTDFIPGIAVCSGISGDTIAVNITGVYTLPKTGGVAIAQGTLLYWDTVGLVATPTAGSLKKLGWAHDTALTAGTSVNVKLYGTGQS